MSGKIIPRQSRVQPGPTPVPETRPRCVPAVVLQAHITPHHAHCDSDHGHYYRVLGALGPAKIPTEAGYGQGRKLRWTQGSVPHHVSPHEQLVRVCDTTPECAEALKLLISWRTALTAGELTVRWTYLSRFRFWPGPKPVLETSTPTVHALSRNRSRDRLRRLSSRPGANQFGRCSWSQTHEQAQPHP